MNRPDISIIIPVYNRGDQIRHTLDSVKTAAHGITVETIVVDDGSTTPVTEDLHRLGLHVDQLIRQENRGLLYARLSGLAAANGQTVLFLDSDDLVSADKLRHHVQAHRSGADIVYSDVGRQFVDDDGPSGKLLLDDELPEVFNAVTFCLSIQPAPHAPSFGTDYLRNRVLNALFPPSPLYNPVAEIWFYHICAPFPAEVRKCPGRAIVGEHQGARLTNNWERLAVASLAVQEAFVRTCPLDTPSGRDARRACAAKAFRAWRALPRDFSPAFSNRVLDLYRCSPERPPPPLLGGSVLRAAAFILGPVRAGRLLKQRNATYMTCRTVDDAIFSQIFHALPPP
jgi:glycosyltransferase involved in cell wall biosynthesis